MGIQIGYVNQVDIVGDDVYIKFIVTEKDVKIPGGSRATVEFSGLGGSKSLEIYPPDTELNPSGKLIIPQSPKRIHDSFSLLNNMYESVIDITYSASHFMKKLGVIKNQAQNNTNKTSINEFLNFSDNWIDGAQKATDKLTRKINKKKDNKKGAVYEQ